MIVVLRNNWYGPDSQLYEARLNPHTLPDSWKDKLPKSAKVDELKPEAAPKK